MSDQSDVTVRLDDHFRLVSAVLAATDFPEKEQARKPHGTHAHARKTARYLKEWRNHEAVKGMQALLDNGAPLKATYTLVAHLPWPSLTVAQLPKWVPPKWNEHLADFYEKTQIADWWEQESELWDAAVSESEQMFKDAEFKAFLGKFFGDVKENLVFMPNISYPGDREIGIQMGTSELIALCPPRLAWGDSPPWPFDEDKPYIHGMALAEYTRPILLGYMRANAEKVVEASKAELPVDDQFRAIYPTWGEQFVALFIYAATSIYLEGLDKREARAYIQEQVKYKGIKALPIAINVLQRYLQEKENGKFDTFIDFLPVFPKHLRVAKRILSI